MTRETEATILAVIGAIIGRLTLQGGHQSFVKSGLYWPLLVSSACLIAVGALTLWQSHRAKQRPEVPADAHSDLHGSHDTVDHHGHGARVGLLLLAPLAVLLLIAPAPLGAFAADRGQANQIGEPARIDFPALPDPVDGGVPLTIGDVLARSFYGAPEALQGVPLRLTGFVMPAGDEGQYRLTRFAVGCCAADAAPRQVLVTGVPAVPATESWVEVRATWTGEVVEHDRTRLPVLALDDQREIDEPAQPYEY